MAKTAPTGPEGTTITMNGIQYYVIGNTFIKITEHFPVKGKQINELIVDLVVQRMREKMGRPS